jgi:hypothetical protein
LRFGREVDVVEDEGEASPFDGALSEYEVHGGNGGNEEFEAVGVYLLDSVHVGRATKACLQ